MHGNIYHSFDGCNDYISYCKDGKFLLVPEQRSSYSFTKTTEQSHDQGRGKLKNYGEAMVSAYVSTGVWGHVPTFPKKIFVFSPLHVRLILVHV